MEKLQAFKDRYEKQYPASAVAASAISGKEQATEKSLSKFLKEFMKEMQLATMYQPEVASFLYSVAERILVLRGTPVTPLAIMQLVIAGIFDLKGDLVQQTPEMIFAKTITGSEAQKTWVKKSEKDSAGCTAVSQQCKCRVN